jgi:hypothetical protein
MEATATTTKTASTATASTAMASAAVGCGPRRGISGHDDYQYASQSADCARDALMSHG